MAGSSLDAWVAQCRDHTRRWLADPHLHAAQADAGARQRLQAGLRECLTVMDQPHCPTDRLLPRLVAHPERGLRLLAAAHPGASPHLLSPVLAADELLAGTLALVLAPEHPVLPVLLESSATARGLATGHRADLLGTLPPAAREALVRHELTGLDRFGLQRSTALGPALRSEIFRADAYGPALDAIVRHLVALGGGTGLLELSGPATQGLTRLLAHPAVTRSLAATLLPRLPEAVTRAVLDAWCQAPLGLGSEGLARLLQHPNRAVRLTLAAHLGRRVRPWDASAAAGNA